MNDARQKIEPALPPALARTGRFTNYCRLILLIVALCVPIAGQAVDPYAVVLERHFAPEQDVSSGVSPQPEISAAESNIVNFESALKLKTQKTVQGLQKEPPLAADRSHNHLLLGFAFLLGAALVLRRCAVQLNKVEAASESRLARLLADPELFAKVRAEEEAFTAFAENFKLATPTPAPIATAAGGREFLARAAENLATLRELFQQVARADVSGSRQKILAECHRQIRLLTTDVGLTNFAAIRQLGSGLEGLLKQVADNPNNCTLSALRTLHAGIELLAALAQPGLAANSVTAADVQLLVVDDDLISRNALAFALKRVFSGPELANNGKDALALAEKQAFDLVFLDVMMPEMDGFELCSRLHFTEANRTTPVVFVTCMDDYESRAKSARVGGVDLLGKPFLTFEVIVKALTLIFRNRLQGQLPAVEPSEFVLAPESADPLEIFDDKDGAPAEEESLLAADSAVAESSEAAADHLTTALAKHISANIATLQTMLQSIGASSDAAEQTEQLTDFYMLIHSLTMNIGLAELEQAAKLSAAVEALIKKLIESPNHRTPSAVHTISEALNLLAELCGGQLPAVTDSEQPIQLLVLDADITSRRLVVGALQTVFEKPDSEEEVAAALALTREKSYDVIFMAIQLPGTDGFALGSKIRDLPANHHTPLVFLAGENDYEVYAETIRSEGMEVIAKPFLPVEINVKALTLALRHRCLPTLDEALNPAEALAMPA